MATARLHELEAKGGVALSAGAVAAALAAEASDGVKRAVEKAGGGEELMDAGDGAALGGGEVGAGGRGPHVGYLA